VSPDPEPNDFFSIAYAYGAIGTGDADGPQARIGDEPFEPQARMGGILFKKAVGFARFFLNAGWKFAVTLPKAGMSPAVQSLSGSSGVVLPDR
jgi:hypothetical protein